MREAAAAAMAQPTKFGATSRITREREFQRKSRERDNEEKQQRKARRDK